MEEHYKNILVAVDLTEDSGRLVRKAKSIASSSTEVKISLLYVLEPLGYAYGGDIPMDLTEVQAQLDNHARKQLSELGTKYDIAIDRQIVAIGRPETEIHTTADNIGADLIIVGSHGKHGWQLLLGSTANGVLHGASCDVLAVRIRTKHSD